MVLEEVAGALVARGVRVPTSEGETVINARCEVIFAAGALQSPKILELSGVGRRGLLERFGILIHKHNENIGEHL